jgi:two-component system cell cycle response regulator DivK
LKATDAELGIELAIKEQPDLILMDVQLPGMDGLQATRVLKENPLTKQIHIIAMTALVMAGDREKIMDAGCNGYVAKPIKYKEFLKLIFDFFEA